MLFSEEYAWEEMLDGLKKLVIGREWGGGENSNERVCCVKEMDLNE